MDVWTIAYLIAGSCCAVLFAAQAFCWTWFRLGNMSEAVFLRWSARCRGIALALAISGGGLLLLGPPLASYAGLFALGGGVANVLVATLHQATVAYAKRGRRREP